jgi:hypothetical protein
MQYDFPNSQGVDRIGRGAAVAWQRRISLGRVPHSGVTKPFRIFGYLPKGFASLALAMTLSRLFTSTSITSSLRKNLILPVIAIPPRRDAKRGIASLR